MVAKPNIVEDNEMNVNLDAVDKAIHKIHTMLYDGKLTLLEIDLIVYTMWTNTQKDKIVQLAMTDIQKQLTRQTKDLFKADEKPKTIKSPKPPGVG